jgi:cytoskeletal protein CcmA (bactofilin family)
MRDAYLADAHIPDDCRLFIGEGVTIRGEIAVPDTLVVCGVLEGDVSAGNLIVCETGVIRGKIIVAENAEIFGKVFDKFDVKRLLILRSTSCIDGTVSYGTLQIEQGASIAGGIASNNLRHEQKSARGEPSQKQEQKPSRHDASSGNGVRSVTQLEPIGFGIPPTSPGTSSAH